MQWRDLLFLALFQLCSMLVSSLRSPEGPDAESALVPLYVGTPAVASHLIHNILRCRENCDENTLARIPWGLVYAP